jgi:hypothetical protein
MSHSESLDGGIARPCRRPVVWIERPACDAVDVVRPRSAVHARQYKVRAEGGEEGRLGAALCLQVRLGHLRLEGSHAADAEEVGHALEDAALEALHVDLHQPHPPARHGGRGRARGCLPGGRRRRCAARRGVAEVRSEEGVERPHCDGEGEARVVDRQPALAWHGSAHLRRG